MRFPKTLSPKTLALLVTALAAAAAPLVIGSYDLNLISRFLAMGVLALGIVLIWGEAGILSLGHGVYFGLGGYALAMHLKLTALAPGEIPDFMVWSGLKALPWWWRPFENPAFALISVVAIPGVVAALFSWMVFHRRVGGTYFALITQALALAFATLLVSQQGATGGFNGLTEFSTLFGADLNSLGATRTLYWVTLAAVIGAALLLAALRSSRFGVLLRAVRDGENRMRFLGYDPTPYKVAAFTLSAMLAGLAGALFTLHAGMVSPALVGVTPSIEMIIWVAIGGRQSLIGAILAALLVNLARDRISSALPELWLYVLGALFIGVVTLMPRGLAGAASDLFARLQRPAALERKEATA
ncbi:urea ABC transporter permease subunit UrtC [Phenylobacterium sp. LjRoot219]|uniref:urea ABC transporter permease subunit UrtC n=1 Tax=Phenylobacterium sp. LjRoot219 TaxID=3342283 RepID=UPI003ED0D5A6